MCLREDRPELICPVLNRGDGHYEACAWSKWSLLAYIVQDLSSQVSTLVESVLVVGKNALDVVGKKELQVEMWSKECMMLVRVITRTSGDSK